MCGIRRGKKENKKAISSLPKIFTKLQKVLIKYDAVRRCVVPFSQNPLVSDQGGSLRQYFSSDGKICNSNRRRSSSSFWREIDCIGHQKILHINPTFVFFGYVFDLILRIFVCQFLIKQSHFMLFWKKHLLGSSDDWPLAADRTTYTVASCY